MPRDKPPELDAPSGDEETLYEKLKGKLRKPKLSRQQALQARPFRNPALKWEELDNGEVRITLPRRRDRVGKLLAAIFYVPENRPLNLDVVGSRVWTLCDGEHTVEDIVRDLVDAHKLHRREAEVSLTEFLKMLGKRNMVAFAVPSESLQGDEPEKTSPEPPEERRQPKPAGPKRGKGKRREGR